MKILVCEDDLMMSKAIEHKLLQENYNVVVAADGREATGLIQSQDFDLIITDLLMPYVNGLEIIRLVRSMSGKTTPLIAFSKLGNEETILEALAAGADDYLAKPFKPSELVIRIKNQLLKKQALPQASVNESEPAQNFRFQTWALHLLKEMTNATRPLNDILLEADAVIREHQIQDEKFIRLIGNEANGYRWDDVPSYRQINTKVYGNFFEARGFGMLASRKDIEITPEYFPEDLREQIYIARINSPAGELESLLKSGEDYLIPLPYFVVSEVSKTLDSKWRIDGLWQKIDIYAVSQVLNTIRLGITGEIVRMLEESDVKKTIKKATLPAAPPLKKQNRSINDLLEASLNKAKEKESLLRKKNNSPASPTLFPQEPQALPQDRTREDVDHFISELAGNLDRIGLSDELKKELSSEIERLQTGMRDPRVKPQTISEALNSINSILHR